MIGKAIEVSMQVADFGLSRQAGDSVDTDTYGTVTHMPPELLMEGKLTKSADVYAFGVLLWEMYTGEVMLSSMISDVAIMRCCGKYIQVQLSKDSNLCRHV